MRKYLPLHGGIEAGGQVSRFRIDTRLCPEGTPQHNELPLWPLVFLTEPTLSWTLTRRWLNAPPSSIRLTRANVAKATTASDSKDAVRIRRPLNGFSSRGD